VGLLYFPRSYQHWHLGSTKNLIWHWSECQFCFLKFSSSFKAFWVAKSIWN
jgi:hypothetical protein